MLLVITCFYLYYALYISEICERREKFLMPRNYDLLSDTLFANPYPLYRRLRSDHPVHFDTS